MIMEWLLTTVLIGDLAADASSGRHVRSCLELVYLRLKAGVRLSLLSLDDEKCAAL